jgi:hypothetical protein
MENELTEQQIGNLRIIGRVMDRVRVDPESGCWVWLGGGNGCIAKDGRDYGIVKMNGKETTLHKLFSEMVFGPVPEGLELDHTCRNRRCFCPGHVERVTHQENVRRGDSIMARRAKQTHCKNGHPLSGDNLFIDKRGNRTCLICRAAYARDFRAKKKVEREQLEQQLAVYSASIA